MLWTGRKRILLTAASSQRYRKGNRAFSICHNFDFWRGSPGCVHLYLHYYLYFYMNLYLYFELAGWMESCWQEGTQSGIQGRHRDTSHRHNQSHRPYALVFVFVTYFVFVFVFQTTNQDQPGCLLPSQSVAPFAAPLLQGHHQVDEISNTKKSNTKVQDLDSSKTRYLSIKNMTSWKHCSI